MTRYSRNSNPRSRIPNPLTDPYLALLLAAILLYIWIFAGLAFAQQAGMRTHKADLGQVDQAIWNTSRGRFVEEVKDDYLSTRLTDHVEPIFALISPVLWLWDDVRALLLLQVIAVAAGAIPLYALALEKFGQLLPIHQRAQIWHNEPLQQRRPELVEGMTRPLALAGALAWLLSPQLQSAVLTELHAIPFAAPLIVWAFWAAEKDRWRQFFIAALLLAAVKEEAALLAAGFGMWGIWRLGIRDWRLGIGRRHFPIPNLQSPVAILILSLLWFYLATFVIVPAHAAPVYDVTASSYFQRYGALGDSPVDIARSFFTQPELVWQIATEPARAIYPWHLLVSFGLFGLLAPEILLLCLPVFLANLLSAYPAQYYGEFHYSAPIVPYFAVSGVYGLARLRRGLGRRFAGESGSYQHLPAASAPVMALVSFFTNSRSALRPLLAGGLALWLLIWAGIGYADAGRGPGGGRFDPTPVTAHQRLLSRFTSQIPAHAAVTATAAVHPHLSHRRYIYQFPYGLEAAVPAQWALLDVTSNTDMAPGDVKAKVDEMLATGWGVLDAADGFLLLRQGEPNTIIPNAFFDFARDFTAKRQSSKEAESFADGSLLNNSPFIIHHSLFTIHHSPFTIHHSLFSFDSLTFLGLDLLDWPRWRQTKVTTLWRVEEGFAGDIQPWVELRTPSGEVIRDSRQLPSPALVWYPPARWQAGEVIRIETLWLSLPAAWGVAVGVIQGESANRLPVMSQTGGLMDTTGTLGLAGAISQQPDGSLLPEAGENLRGGQARGWFVGPAGERVTLTARLDASVAAGQRADLRLEWRTDRPELFQQQQIFAHLRGVNGNIAQNDGSPRVFVPVVPAAMTPDWRQFAIPTGLPPGNYQVIIGLYNPASGERLAAFDADGQLTGNELLIGSLRVDSPLIPDQACALVPSTCASQPRN